jgi:formiminoglutamase
MNSVIVYTNKVLETLVRQRTFEEKIGQQVLFSGGNWEEDLAASACRFVLLGVSEDIGVRANFGRAGAATAIKPALESFLNQQENVYLSGKSVFLLGELNVKDLMQEAESLNPRHLKDLERLRLLTAEVDQLLFPVIEKITAMNKIPVIIGGGHNNAYGNICGASKGLGQAVNTINCDPHLDFRALEGRHSGNGFSYAFAEKHLNKYAVLGMHEQYNNQKSLQDFSNRSDALYYRSYESIFIRAERDFKEALSDCIGFVRQGPCGIELDLDAITNVPSSAKTSSGISALQARQYIYQSARQLSAAWLHIAEGAPVLSHIKADNKTGKLISYLMTDFMKGVLEREADSETYF